MGVCVDIERSKWEKKKKMLKELSSEMEIEANRYDDV